MRGGCDVTSEELDERLMRLEVRQALILDMLLEKHPEEGYVLAPVIKLLDDELFMRYDRSKLDAQ